MDEKNKKKNKMVIDGIINLKENEINTSNIIDNVTDAMF